MSAVDRLADNPFYVLDIPPTSTAVEVERQGQKLLAMLGVGLSSVATYCTPFGPQERTEDAVRQALAALRDPTRRAEAEAWFHLPSPGPAPQQAPRWTDLRERLGWR
jgi:hypothetical protein